jgi:IS30 family transposase
MNIEELDSNWVTPAMLAAELNVARSTVSSWIYRNQITFCKIEGANKRRYLVDRRTAPALKVVGRPSN